MLSAGARGGVGGVGGVGMGGWGRGKLHYYILLYMKRQENRVSDSRYFVCSFVSKGNFLDFVSSYAAMYM